MTSQTLGTGRLVVVDEGAGEIVSLDMYRNDIPVRLSIRVTRRTLRLYAQKLLEAGNRGDNDADQGDAGATQSPGL